MEINVDVTSRIRPIPPEEAGRVRSLPSDVRDALFQDNAGTTYAVLDAARIFGLRELVDAQNDRGKCLFIGEAQNEHGDVAPWLVQLSPDASLTRALLSEGDPPQGLWNASPGILLRSHLSFDEVYRHLRRFLSINDHAGRRMFWRFWEPTFWGALTGLQPSTWTTNWPVGILRPFDRLILLGDGMGRVMVPHAPSDDRSQDGTPDAADISVIVCAMARPKLHAHIRGVSRKHWSLPHLGTTARNEAVQDEEIERMLDIPSVSGKAQLIDLFLRRTPASPKAHARFIRYVTG